MAQTSRDLKHNIGSSIQLQISPSNKDERFYVKLVGFLENKSVIVTTPRVDGVPLKFEERQKFIVRMMSGSSAQVFTATTIFSTSRPYPHLHLTFPETLESITIRKAERVNCKLIVTVQNEEAERSLGEGKSSSMQDISTAGAQIFSDEPLAEVGDTITINSKISVADIEQYLTISGKVRRVVIPKDEQGSFEYGVEFILIEDKDKLLLHGFVYEQMLKES